MSEDCLVLSVLQGEIQNCITLLCDGVDPNTVSATGEPLLHLAIREPLNTNFPNQSFYFKVYIMWGVSENYT